jgi:hypothetical protein
MPVTDDHGSSHRRWDDRGAPAHVERLGATRHHHPHHRGVTGDPSCGTGRDRAGVIELRRAPITGECIRADGHAEVRSFSSHVRPIGGVQPLPADLPQGIGSTLRGRAVIALVPGTCLGVEHGSKSRQQGLSGLGIEVPVYPDHAQEGDRGVQPATLSGGVPLDPSIVPAPRAVSRGRSPFVGQPWSGSGPHPRAHARSG